MKAELSQLRQENARLNNEAAEHVRWVLHNALDKAELKELRELALELSEDLKEHHSRLYPHHENCDTLRLLAEAESWQGARSAQKS